MPYIHKDERSLIDLDNAQPRTIGQLNYSITQDILLYIDNITIKDGVRRRPNYADLNSVVGMLECCKLEFYRRAVAAYEDEKIKENGDVYYSGG